MKIVNKTYEDLIVVVQLLNANFGDQTNKGQKKLLRISEKFKPYIDEYNEALQDLRLENASVDSQNNLILDEKGGYKFTKDGTKNFNKQSRELLKKLVDFEIIEISHPDGLEIYSFLDGWVTGVDFFIVPNIEI